MNKIKSSGLIRLIAFFLVAIVMVCTFGFAADGWTLKEQDITINNSNSSPSLDNSPNSDEDSDETDNTPDIYIPEYTNYLTGLETTEEISTKRPISFVMDSDSPLYGISHSEVLVEIPVDNGQTRLICITTDLNNMWKIGSIAPSRGYISNVGKFFNSVIASSGDDDSITYNSCDVSSDSLKLSQDAGYSYSEYSYYLYTNLNLVNSALIASGLNMSSISAKQLPYIFQEFGKDELVGPKPAANISLVYSANVGVDLNYSLISGKYTFSRNGNLKNDLLDGKNLEFKNCFVLFADSVTYEGSNGSQTVMNTIGNGLGYYFTNGTVTEFKWSSNIDGQLIFTDLNDQPLCINRGNIYIGFIKSSRPDKVSFS